MHDFCEEEVDLLSVSLTKTKHEVEFKDRQKFSWTKIRTLRLLGLKKKTPGFPREALEVATFKAPQGEKKLATFVVALTHDR